MRHIVFALAILLSTSPVACDDNAFEDVALGDPSDVEFREDYSLLLYKYQDSPPVMSVTDFGKLILMCKDSTLVAITFTEYPTKYSVDNLRVLGMSMSALAPDSLIDCFRKRMYEVGAQPL
jgi:hypothetical protein